MRLVLLTLAALIPLSAVAAAEEVELGQALREAVAARPAAMAARAEASAATAAIGEARSGYLPRLALKEAFVATDEPAASLFLSLNQERLRLYPVPDPYNDPASVHDYETRFTLEQRLFDPDVGYTLRGARAAAEAARASADWSEEAAAFDAFRAYLEVQQARGALGWVESSRQEAVETLRVAEQRQEAGVGLKADTLRARVALAEAERRSLAAGNDLILARSRLALTMGRPGGEVDITRNLTPADLPLESGLQPFLRADLRAAVWQTEQAEQARRKARADYLPRLGVQADYAWHDRDHPFGTESGSWQVAAGLSWELFDGLRRGAGVERATAQRYAAERREEEARRSVVLLQREAVLRAAEAESHLGSARAAAAEAEEVQRLLRQRYEAGMADLADLLGAQTALDRTRYDTVTAESRMLLARGNLRLQQGVFLKAMLPGREKGK